MASRSDGGGHDDDDERQSLGGESVGLVVGASASASACASACGGEPALGDHGLYQPLWVRLACIAIDFLTQVYDQIRIVPEMALFERALCRAYYAADDPPERLCKVDAVQQQLAGLRSWKAFFDGVATFITALPMGVLADRFGRKSVLAASILGPICATAWVIAIGYDAFGWHRINLIWLSSLFFLCGNLSSANATVYAVAADSCPPSERSRYFYYLYSTFLVCELFAPALAGATLDRSLLIPFGIGLGALLLCYPILAAMPETHRPLDKTAVGPKTRRGGDGEGVEADPEAEGLLSPAAAHRRARDDGHDGDDQDEPIVAHPVPHGTFLSVLRQRNLVLALVVLFVGALRQASVSVLLQYAAARFGWPMARTAMLISAIAAMNIVLFLLILPQCIVFLVSRRHVPAQLIDYNIVSVSLAVLALGSLFMGLAPSAHFLVPAVLFFAAGYGTRVAVLSLITVWTPEDLRARTFAIAQIVEHGGRMCADPLLLRIFGASLHLDGVWPGLPFLVAAAGFSAGLVAWTFVRLDLHREQ